MYSRLEARAASYKSTALFASRGRTSAKFLESQFFWTFLAGPGTQGPGGTVLCDLPRHLRAGTRAGTGCNRHQDRTLKGGHETLRWGMVIPTLWPLLQRMGSPEMWLGCKTTVWKTDIFNEAVLDPPPLALAAALVTSSCYIYPSFTTILHFSIRTIAPRFGMLLKVEAHEACPGNCS